MKTPPNSVRTIAPVGQASRHPAFSQCLQTSDEKDHEFISGALPPKPGSGVCSTNFTCRHVCAPTAPVLSYENPLQFRPSSPTAFHSLHATSQALQPIHNVESVRNAVIAIDLLRVPSCPSRSVVFIVIFIKKIGCPTLRGFHRVGYHFSLPR